MRKSKIKSDLNWTVFIWGMMFSCFLIALIVEIPPIVIALVGAIYGIALVMWLIDVCKIHKISP